MQRQTELQNWLRAVYPEQNFELSFAVADYDFRLYFRAAFGVCLAVAGRVFA